MSGANVDLNNHFYTEVSVFTVLCEHVLLQEININVEVETGSPIAYSVSCMAKEGSSILLHVPLGLKL